jgi:hypothetical protein
MSKISIQAICACVCMFFGQEFLTFLSAVKNDCHENVQLWASEQDTMNNGTFYV